MINENFLNNIENNVEFVSFKNNAIDFRNKSQYELAIENYNKCLEIKNDESTILEGLGFCYFNTKKYTDCILCYEKLNFQEFETSVRMQIFYNLGFSYASNLEDPDEEKAHYYINLINELDILGENKNLQYNIYYSLGYSFYALKDYKKAIEYLEIVSQKCPKNYDRRVMYGRALLFMGNVDDALKVFKDVYSENYSCKENLEWLINLYYYFKKDYEEALRYCQEYFHDKKLEDNSKQYIRAACIGKVEGFEVGLDKLEQHMKNCKNSDSYSRMVNYLYFFGKYDDALKYAREAQRRREYNYEIIFYHMESDILLAQKKYEDAFQAMVEFNKYNSKGCMHYMSLPKFLFTQFTALEIYNYSLKVIDVIIKQESDEIKHYISKAKIYYMMKEYKKSIEVISKSLYIRKFGKAYYFVALNFYKLNRVEFAIEHTDLSIKEFPTYINSYYMKYLLLIVLKKYDSAKEVINQMEELIKSKNVDYDNSLPYKVKKRVAEAKIEIENFLQGDQIEFSYCIKEKRFIEKENSFFSIEEKIENEEIDILLINKKKIVEKEKPKDKKDEENNNFSLNKEFIQDIINDMNSKINVYIEKVNTKLKENTSMYEEKLADMKKYYESKFENYKKNTLAELEKELISKMGDEIKILGNSLYSEYTNKELTMKVIESIKHIQKEFIVKDELFNEFKRNVDKEIADL